MGLGMSQLAVSRLTAQSFKMLSALTVNLDDLIQKDRATIVFADIVNVRSLVTSKGYDITIVCRVLVFDKNGRINTAGSPGIGFDPGVVQEGARDPGAAGVDGRAGTAGGNGGKVTIYAGKILGTPNIVSTGGNGGRAEDGGAGHKGLDGSAGAIVERRWNTVNANVINGGNGGNGGSAGLPGYRSPGGNGGDVSLFTMDTLPECTIETSGGQPSNPAIPGEPGLGGKGGDPGKLYVFERLCGNFKLVAEKSEFVRSESTADTSISYLQQCANQLSELDIRNLFVSELRDPNGAISPLFERPPREICIWECTEVIDGTRGENGEMGASRESEVNARNALPQTSVSGRQALKQVTVNEFATVTHDEWLELLMLSTENDYRRSGLSTSDELRERATFLMRVCSNLKATTLIQKEIYGRVYTMLRRLELGLDFYGYSLERVPLLSFDEYSKLLSNVILPQAKTIETAFFHYWDESRSIEERRTAVRLSMDEAKTRKRDIERLYSDCKDSTTRQLDELNALDSRVKASFEAIMKAQEVLNNAIEKKTNGGCKHLADALVAVGTIVAGVATGGGALLASASAGFELWDHLSATDGGLKGLWNKRSILEGDLKKIGAEAGTVAGSIKSIQEAVQKLSDDQKNKPQFRMERLEFDRVAKDFAELEEAKAYKEAGYDYLASVETRNQAIVDYNALLLQLIEFRVQLNATERVVDGMESALNAYSDPAEPYLIGMMNRLYLDTLSMTAQLVHAERKALNYNFGRLSDAPVSALNVADLTASFVSNQTQWVKWKEQAKRKQKLVPGQLKLDLSKLVTSDMWNTFKQTGLLAFTIRYDHEVYAPVFEWLPGLRLTGFRLKLEGARTASNQPYLPAILTHSGGERVYLADGSYNVFSHRATQYRSVRSVNSAEGDLLDSDFSEDGIYAGVSPFANWFLEVSNHPSLKLDLSELKSAMLEVNGYMIDG